MSIGNGNTKPEFKKGEKKSLKEHLREFQYLGNLIIYLRQHRVQDLDCTNTVLIYFCLPLLGCEHSEEGDYVLLIFVTLLLPLLAYLAQSMPSVICMNEFMHMASCRWWPWRSELSLSVIEFKWEGEWCEWWPGLTELRPSLEARYLWACVTEWWAGPRQMTRIIGAWGVVHYCVPWHWSLSPAPLPHVCALRKGGCREAEAVSIRYLLSVGQALVPSDQESQSRKKVIIPTSTQSTAWFRNSGGLMGTHGHFGTSESWITRAWDGVFDTEAPGWVGLRAVIVEGPVQTTERGQGLTGEGPGSKEPWEAHTGVWDRRPETIRGILLF